MSRNEQPLAFGRYAIRLLRHGVPGHPLELDGYGWASWGEFVRAVQIRFPEVDLASIERLVENCPKQRFRREGERVAAWYGHSLPLQEPDRPVVPPELLYHGTKSHVVCSIQEQGLMPGRRKYVHLSRQIDDALIVGNRRQGETVVLQVRAADAHRAGHVFYDKSRVFVTASIPAAFIFGSMFRAS